MARAGEAEIKFLSEMFSGDPIRAEMFAPAFLAQVPLEQVQTITDQLTGTIGPVVEISPAGGDLASDDYIVTSASHTLSVILVLDEAGKVAALRVQPPVQVDRSIEEILREMAALSGSVGYFVTRDGQVLHAHNGEEPLAVGSAYKIGILAVLVEKFASGDAAWDTVLRLWAHQVSLTSGMLQQFVVGSPLTLHTLAAMMISISDNTGADMLLDFVGRDAVAAKLNVDFVIKTREMFLLKSNPDLRARFGAASVEEKHQLALDMDDMPLPAARDVSGPHIQGIEYYVSLATLCPLIAQVAMLDVMQINPGLADKNDWQKIAFKGGSEQGVLNLTSHMIGSDGTPVCVGFTWNDDQALDTARATTLYASLLKALAR